MPLYTFNNGATITVKEGQTVEVHPTTPSKYRLWKTGEAWPSLWRNIPNHDIPELPPVEEEEWLTHVFNNGGIVKHPPNTMLSCGISQYAVFALSGLHKRLSDNFAIPPGGSVVIPDLYQNWKELVLLDQQPVPVLVGDMVYGNKKNVTKKVDTTKELKDLKVSDFYFYPNLSKYSGLEGRIPVRAETTYVGVEIELEGVSFKTDVSGTWKVTEDGSLKEAGQEFVSVPIPVRYLEVELDRLFASLKTKKASSRCSVHVHLNARDFTLEELKSFILLYMIFEKALYNYSGGRWNNNFCVPLAFSPLIVQQAIKEIDENKTIPTTWYKYFGFNLCPLYGGESTRIGTIEFRQMKGSTDTAYIINWINLIVSLKISAKKMSFDDLIAQLETLNTTSAYFLLAEHVFKDYYHLIVDQPNFQKEVERCITTAKTVFLPAKPVAEQLF